jgi:predicted nuclease of predicted toxin-antitoxin system
MLKLLANENIPRLLVARLRELGHDVRWMLEEQRGIDDPLVLAQSIQQGRVLLTNDKDFGHLVFRQGKDASCGIILIRLISRSQTELTELVVPVLERLESSWPGQFAVISEKKIRIVNLPHMG